MKNPKTPIRVLSLLLLCMVLLSSLAAFTGCHRRDKYAQETETDPVTDPVSEQESGTVIEETYRHGVNPYEGMTPQDLVDLYRGGQVVNMTNNGLPCNTPYYYVSDVQNGGSAFNKLTGEIVRLCKDPLCRHDLDCPFAYSNSMRCMAVSEDRIYAIMSGAAYVNDGQGVESAYRLFSFTYSFDEPRLLHTWSQSADVPYYIFPWDGKLYYMSYLRQDGETQHTLFVLDPETGKTAPFETDNESVAHETIGMVGKYLFYNTRNSETDAVRRLDMETGEDIRAVARSVVHPEDGEFDVVLSSVFADGERMVVFITGTGPDGRMRTSHYMTLVGSDVLTPITERLCGNISVYFHDHLSEAFDDDPLHDYYHNQFGMRGHDVPSGGELWCCPPEGGPEELLCYCSTDGHPDNLSPPLYDGKCIYVQYDNYRGFANIYNPKWDPAPVNYYTREGCDQYLDWEGLLVIDVETQTVLNVGPANDFVWYPNRGE